MAAYVLVHGAWHGGWCWQRLTPLLREAGHDVHAPTLTGLGERAHLRACAVDLDVHLRDVLDVIEFEGLHDVVLVGHSLGGIKVPAIASRIPDRVRHLVNIDGLIPSNGQSIADLIPDVWRASRQQADATGDPGWAAPPAWDFGLEGDDLGWVRSRLTPDPIATWETPMSLDDNRLAHIPKTFVHCTAALSDEEITRQREKSVELGWRYTPLRAAHDAMVSAPRELAAILLQDEEGDR